MADGVALDSFDGNIIGRGGDTFRVVDLMTINVAGVVVGVVVVYSLIDLDCLAEVEHELVNFRFIM